MNKTVHIFFNGRDVVMPSDNGWEKFEQVDALRTFLICADSWRRAGWEVKRLSTAPFLGLPAEPYCRYTPTPFSTTGRAAAHYKWYPPEFWQYIAKAMSVCEPGLNMFCTMDVINNGFTPALFQGLTAAPNCSECISFQVEHFSMGCFAATKDYLKHAESILLAYDRGELTEIRGDYVSDERILREYLPGATLPFQKFACSEGDYPLIHFARSTLARIYREIPLS